MGPMEKIQCIHRHLREREESPDTLAGRRHVVDLPQVIVRPEDRLQRRVRGRGQLNTSGIWLTLSYLQDHVCEPTRIGLRPVRSVWRNEEPVALFHRVRCPPNDRLAAKLTWRRTGETRHAHLVLHRATNHDRAAAAENHIEIRHARVLFRVDPNGATGLPLFGVRTLAAGTSRCVVTQGRVSWLTGLTKRAYALSKWLSGDTATCCTQGGERVA